jgi:hypothetical protein
MTCEGEPHEKSDDTTPVHHNKIKSDKSYVCVDRFSIRYQQVSLLGTPGCPASSPSAVERQEATGFNETTRPFHVSRSTTTYKYGGTQNNKVGLALFHNILACSLRPLESGLEKESPFGHHWSPITFYLVVSFDRSVSKY